MHDSVHVRSCGALHGHLDICKRGCNCFPPEVGTAPSGGQGSQGSAFQLARRPRDRASLSFRVDSTCVPGAGLAIEPRQGTLCRLFRQLTTIGRSCTGQLPRLKRP